MREPYIEGVATHGDPESCVAVREGRCEALTGARAGTVIEPRKNWIGVPTLLDEAEGHMIRRVIVSDESTPRGRRAGARTEAICARTGRSR